MEPPSQNEVISKKEADQTEPVQADVLAKNSGGAITKRKSVNSIDSDKEQPNIGKESTESG